MPLDPSARSGPKPTESTSTTRRYNTRAVNLFARPDPASHVTLPGVPVLESWNAADHPDQLRLKVYLDEVAGLIGTGLSADREPLSVELVVGLAPEVDLDRG